MPEQVELLPGFFVDPVPKPHVQVRRLMHAASVLIDGPVNAQPEALHPCLRHCLFAEAAGIVVAGTRCPRPLMLREMVDISNVVQHDVVVVRLENPSTAEVTFDVNVFGAGQAAVAYRLWMPQPTGTPWLIPIASEDRYFRLDPAGIGVCEDAPFVDEFDRHRGLVWAAEFMSVATKGWF